jgi:DNA-binding XRE family transcriptional regulator
MIALTPEQSRAARCFMDWSRNELAKVANISAETIKNFETGVFSPNASTRAAIIATFEAQGLEFIEGGVKRKAACVNCGYSNGFVPPATQAEEPHVEAAS